MKDNQKVFLNALNLIPGIGYETISKISEYFQGDFEAGFKASQSQLKQAGIKDEELEAISTKRDRVNPEEEFEKLSKEGVQFVVIGEKKYPRLLKEIFGAPFALYIRGDLKEEDNFAFGVVGTRLATDYGKDTAYSISLKLAQSGLTIVSGLAYGIDAKAHKGALDGGGRTIAVLGSGLDDKTIFPQENVKLANKIIENGALISEYPVGAEPTKEKFPFRNRIISGLSRGVLIVEAPLKSGALITAKCALEQNRDVFAIPGSIFSRMSFGANLLIKQGATLVTRAEDILQELNIKFGFETGRVFKPANEIEQKIFQFLGESGEPRHIDDIIRNSGLSVQKISASLTAMEMKGMVRSLGSGKFSLPQNYEFGNS